MIYYAYGRLIERYGASISIITSPIMEINYGGSMLKYCSSEQCQYRYTATKLSSIAEETVTAQLVVCQFEHFQLVTEDKRQHHLFAYVGQCPHCRTIYLAHGPLYQAWKHS